MGLRIILIPISMENGNMMIPTQTTSVPQSSSDPLKRVSFSSAKPSSIRIPLPINSRRGSILNQVLIILSKVKCEFNLNSKNPTPQSGQNRCPTGRSPWSPVPEGMTCAVLPREQLKMRVVQSLNQELLFQLLCSLFYFDANRRIDLSPGMVPSFK